MTWDKRDLAESHPLTAPGFAPGQEPTMPAMLPALALQYGMEDWLDDDPLTLDNLPAAELDDLRLHGLTPPSQWRAVRRLMTRGIAPSD